MANEKIEMGDLQDTINEILDEYAGNMEEVVKETITEVSKEAVKKLRSTSPNGPGGYAKKWSSKITEERLEIQGVVYNKKYPLVHLLEHDHALRNGGRSRAIPHVAPVNDWAQEETIKRIKEGIEK